MIDAICRNGLLAAMLALGGGTASAQSIQIQDAGITTHRSQGEIRPIEGGSAKLLRSDDGVFVGLDTVGLTPGNAYTLLLVVINNPSACAASPCEPADVFGNTAQTSPDFVTLDGAIVGEDGTARFAGYQAVGDFPNAWFGNGLRDSRTAEFHLLINDHGPLVPDLAPAMVNTYRGGCADEGIPSAFPDTARADGQPGPNTCRLLQVAIFSPEARQAVR